MEKQKNRAAKSFLNQIIDLSDFTAYQKGSIVSNELVNKKTGTITIFAFDKGEGLSEHSAPFDAILNVLDGEAMVSISKKKFRVKKGQMIIMPANEPHAVKAVKKFKMMLIMIKS